MFEPLTVLLVAGTFLLAGTVKGVIGLGLPLVSLAFLTVALDLPTAMVLTLVPSFITNLWQAVAGGSANIIVRRLWPFLLMATVTVWIGVHALASLNMISLRCQGSTNLSGGKKILNEIRHWMKYHFHRRI